MVDQIYLLLLAANSNDSPGPDEPRPEGGGK